MSCSSSENGGGSNLEKKYKGVRRRKWGKWVSEIRVPGTQERLWLGTYATPEGAAVAHDVAFYCLRRPCKLNKLNFPEMLLSYCVLQREADLSPRSVQKVASDAGMAVDAQNIAGMTETYGVLMEKTNDEQRQSNVNVCNGSALIQNNIISNDGIWWEGVINNLDDFNGTIWGGSEEHRTGDGEALSISIEDYL